MTSIENENKCDKISFQSISKKDDTIICPICFDKYVEYFIAECKHAWCHQCNLNIESNLCPLCRKPFKQPIKKINEEIYYVSYPVIRTRRIRRNNVINNAFGCGCNIQ